MRVVNRESFVNRVLELAEAKGYTSNQLYTIRKIAERTRELRIEEGKALVLLGMNVYTVTYDAYMEAAEQEFYEINDSEYNEETMVKELDANDKRIDKN